MLPQSYQIGEKVFSSQPRAPHPECKHFFFADLSGRDFSGLDFRHAQFIGCRLDNANFREADLEGALIAYCYFSSEGAAPQFDSAEIEKITFHDNAFSLNLKLEAHADFVENHALALAELEKFGFPILSHLCRHLKVWEPKYLGFLAQLALKEHQQWPYNQGEAFFDLLEACGNEWHFAFGLVENILRGGFDLDVAMKDFHFSTEGQIGNSALQWATWMPWDLSDLSNGLWFESVLAATNAHSISQLPWQHWLESPDTIPLKAWQVLKQVIIQANMKCWAANLPLDFATQAIRDAAIALLHTGNAEKEAIALDLLSEDWSGLEEVYLDLEALSSKLTSAENQARAWRLFLGRATDEAKRRELLAAGRLSQALFEDFEDVAIAEEEELPLDSGAQMNKEIIAGLQSAGPELRLAALRLAAQFPDPSLFGHLEAMQDMDLGMELKVQLIKALDRCKALR